MTTVTLVVALGFALGVVLGLTGIGAGSLLTPALVLLGVRPVVAVGTSLFFALCVKPVGALQHLRQGTVDLRTLRWLAAGSVPAALLSLLLVKLVTRSPQLSDGFTRHAVAAALIVVAVVLTLRLADILPRRRDVVPGAVLVLVGAFVGGMVAVTSVGSGSVTLALLGVLTPLTVGTLVGTDMAHGALLAAVTAPFYVFAGNVDVPLAVGLAVGSVPGVVVGSRLTVAIPEPVTRGAVVLAVWLVALRSL